VLEEVVAIVGKVYGLALQGLAFVALVVMYRRYKRHSSASESTKRSYEEEITCES
jgi:hypothetical protein